MAATQTLFSEGRRLPVTDASQADGASRPPVRRDGDLDVIRIGRERYAVPAPLYAGGGGARGSDTDLAFRVADLAGPLWRDNLHPEVDLVRAPHEGRSARRMRYGASAMADFEGYYAWRIEAGFETELLIGPTGPLTVTNEDNTLSGGAETFLSGGNVYTYRGQVEGDPDGFAADMGGSTYYFSRNADQYGSLTDVPGIINGFGEVTLACFLPGTLIATPLGNRAVERLAIGDLVLTADGRAVPIRWIGRQTIASLFMPGNRRPVAIAAGALGDGLPLRELRVTADHALLLDGVLANAGALVNGTTIRSLAEAELGPSVTVFHIETAGHEIVLAEGCPTETFLDNVTRARFDNHAEFLALHGTEAPIAERPEPRAASARQVPRAIRERIAAIAAEAVARAA
jgi:hypothetical protein